MDETRPRRLPEVPHAVTGSAVPVVEDPAPEDDQPVQQGQPEPADNADEQEHDDPAI